MALPEIQLGNVLRCVVIRVIRLLTRLALKLPGVSVIVVRESTLVTPLRRIPRIRRINEQSFDGNMSTEHRLGQETVAKAIFNCADVRRRNHAFPTVRGGPSRH